MVSEQSPPMSGLDTSFILVSLVHPNFILVSLVPSVFFTNENCWNILYSITMHFNHPVSYFSTLRRIPIYLAETIGQFIQDV